ncbi:MAG: S-layer family protein [Moorea sp. SIO4A3]|nr:S-layer family protein [Moorena sp. SIO4A3]
MGIAFPCSSSTKVQGNFSQDISLSEGALVTTNGESGGSIQVQGANVSLRDRSLVSANTNGSGSGGGIVVKASQLSLEGDSTIFANVSGSGQGGDLTVDATESVRVLGAPDAPSSLGALVFSEATGNGGDISITTGELIVSDGAQVNTATFGEGDAGNLTVDADSTVQVIGRSADGRFISILFADTFATGKAGDVSITTGELIVSDGAQVSTETFGEGDGGNLTVDADSTVQVIGTSASGGFSGLLTRTLGKGKAGDVSITTDQLIVSDGAVVSASTDGEGNAGNLTVNADSKVQLIGTSADGRIASGLFANTEGTGNAGELKITTGQLIVSDGAVVSASTDGEGNGGNLIVDADSKVQVIGTSADVQFISALFADTEGTGNAGNLSITTGELIVSDGGEVSASTFGEGNGGNLTVDADSKVQLIGTSADGQISSGLSTQANRGATGNAGDVSITTGELIVSDGAVVSATTFGEGNGGNLTVDADSTVQLIGTSADGQIPSGLFTQAQATGNAGELLSITTGELIISDGAVVSARSFEQGSSAGTVDINANSIFLDNGGRITAETAGEKGNIILEARDIRLLNESLILTDARNTTTGGNIVIDTDTLLGLGNSDITANAQQGRGGSVTIKAKGIFGLEFRDRLTPDNDITSTSNLGSSFNGEVILNTPDVDPTSGLTELPASLVDAEAILANDLCGFENNRIAGGSSFFITGKGGLPPTPEDPVINAHRTVGWRTRPGLASSRKPLQQPPLAFGHESRSVTQPQPPQEKKVIIEALGWVTAKDGTIILTAHPFRGTPVDQILPHLDCHSGGGSRE